MIAVSSNFRAVKNIFSVFSDTRQRTDFCVFLPPTRPHDVTYDAHGQPRSTPETPRRRPSSVVYVRVLIHDTRHNDCAQHNAAPSSHIHDNATSDLVVVKETKRPDLLGRPHCKGMAIGVARRGARRSGERTLRIPPSCSDPVSHACGPHVASFVRRSSVRGLAKARACGRAACGQERTERKKERPAKKKGGNPEKERENAKRATRPSCGSGVRGRA